MYASIFGRMHGGMRASLEEFNGADEMHTARILYAEVISYLFSMHPPSFLVTYICGCEQVVMLFPHAFWRKADMFGRIAPTGQRRGEFFLFYSYANLSGGAVLAALVAGEAGVEFEEVSPEENTRRVMTVLTSIFNPKGIHVPTPLQVTVLPVFVVAVEGHGRASSL